MFAKSDPDFIALLTTADLWVTTADLWVTPQMDADAADENYYSVLILLRMYLSIVKY
jgi:hypothetical protein